MELLTFETAKGKFPQFAEGDKLLTTIKNYVRKEGRMRLLYKITNKEAPDWFDNKTKARFRKKFRKYLMQLNTTAVNPKLDTVLWSKEDEQILIDNWKTLHTSAIARIVKRQRKAVENKALALFTPEEYKQRKYIRVPRK